MNFHPEQNRRRIDVIVDVTPLIDVVFLLLIFFMITTTFVNSPGLEVDLPKASSSDTQAQPSDVTIAVDEEGEIVFRHKKVSEQELSALLEAAQADNPNATVIVQADQEVFHGLVVKVMDIAKNAGFSKLAIATQEN